MNPKSLNDDDGVDEIPAEITANGHLRYLLTAYLFESISDAGRKEVESHLAGCADCRRELDDLSETLGLVREAFQPPPGAAPYSFEERRVKRVLERAGRGPRKRFWSRKAIVALAATVLIAGMIRFFSVTLMAPRGRSESFFYAERSAGSQNAAPALAEFTPAGDFRPYAAPETAAEPATAPAPAQNEPAVALHVGVVNQDGLIDLAVATPGKPALLSVAPGSGGGGGRATVAAGGTRLQESLHVRDEGALVSRGTIEREGTASDVAEIVEARKQLAGTAAAPAPKTGRLLDLIEITSIERSDAGRAAGQAGAETKLLMKQPAAAAPLAAPAVVTEALAEEESNVSGSLGATTRGNASKGGKRNLRARGGRAPAIRAAKTKVQELAQVTDALATEAKPTDLAKLKTIADEVPLVVADAEQSLSRAGGETRENKLGAIAQGWSFAEQTKGMNTTDYGLYFGGVAGAPPAGPGAKADDKKMLGALTWDVTGVPSSEPAQLEGPASSGPGAADGADRLLGSRRSATLQLAAGDDAKVTQEKAKESVSVESRFDDQQTRFFEQLGIDAVSANQGLNGAESNAPIRNLVAIMNRSDVASRGEAKNLAGRVSESQLRSWYFYKAADPTLRADVFWKRHVAVPRPEPGDEGLGQEEFRKKYGVHPFVETSRDRVSTFGMDVDTASYNLARSLLAQGKLPDPKTVRVEEWVNSFREEVEADPKSVFTVHTEGGPSPFGIGLEMLKVTVKARELKPSERKSAVLTFAIDASGSMALEKRLALLKDSLRTLVNSLSDDDRVAIVAFGANASLVLPHTRAAERTRILGAIDALAASGGTNVEAGLDLAYRLADENLDPRAVNRVLLASDGVANVGSRGPDDILTKVRVFAGRGIFLSCVGFGGGRYNDAMLETLSKRGNGNYAYVDSVETARALFETNLPSTLQVLAADAKIQVEFNPESVTRYRLLGYERRDIADKDFRNDKIDAGEVGPGSTVTVLYEIQRRAVGSGELATVRMRYRDVGTGRVEEEARPVQQGVLAARPDETSPRFRFIASVAEAAELLRGSYWARDGSHENILEVLATLDAGYQAREEVKAFGDLVIQARDATLKTLLSK